MKDLEQAKINKILIVEDEFVNILVIKGILSRLKIEFDVLEAENGKEAVETYIKNPDINIILMDIKMPVMDGFEATKKIKEINPDVPIIIQTAFTSDREKNIAFELGCDGYISKPIKINEFRDLLGHHLNLEFEN